MYATLFGNGGCWNISITLSSAICAIAFKTLSTCTSPLPTPSNEEVDTDLYISYIVVDLMNGGDLRFHISRKTFTEEAVRFWIAELGCALRYIHQQGIVHRDLKPDNVLLDSEGHVHLADFVCSERNRSISKLLNSRRMLHLSSDLRRSCTASQAHWHTWRPRYMGAEAILMRWTGGHWE